MSDTDVHSYELIVSTYIVNKRERGKRDAPLSFLAGFIVGSTPDFDTFIDHVLYHTDKQ